MLRQEQEKPSTPPGQGLGAAGWGSVHGEGKAEHCGGGSGKEPFPAPVGFASQSWPSSVQTCSSDPDTTSGTETTVVFFKNSAGDINCCATSGFAPLWPNLSPREQGIIHLQSLGLQQPCRGAAGKLLFEPHLQSNLLPVSFSWWCWGPGGLQFHLPARWQLRFPVLCAGHGTATTLLAQPAATALAGGCSCKSCFLQVKRKPGVWPHSPQPLRPHAAPAAAAGMASPSMQPAVVSSELPLQPSRSPRLFLDGGCAEAGGTSMVKPPKPHHQFPALQIVLL